MDDAIIMQLQLPPPVLAYPFVDQNSKSLQGEINVGYSGWGVGKLIHISAYDNGRASDIFKSILVFG